MKDDRPQENFQHSSEDNGQAANLDRPKRAASTLDLDATEISDKAGNIDSNAAPSTSRSELSGIASPSGLARRQ